MKHYFPRIGAITIFVCTIAACSSDRNPLACDVDNDYSCTQQVERTFCDREGKICIVPPDDANSFSCQLDEECKSLFPERSFCDQSACVGCVSNDHCLDANALFCDATSRSCRGCNTHSECPSLACDLERGECIEESYIVYTDSSVESTDEDPACTRELPCKTLARAVTQLGPEIRTIVMAGGEYTGPAVAIDDLSVQLIANGGVTFTPSTLSNNAAISIAGKAMVVQLSGIHLQTTGVGSTGIRCTGTGAGLAVAAKGVDISDFSTAVEVDLCALQLHQSKLVGTSAEGTLTGITATNNSHLLLSTVRISKFLHGLQATESFTSIDNSTLSDNALTSIWLHTGGELTLDKSIVSGNQYGIHAVEPGASLQIKDSTISNNRKYGVIAEGVPVDLSSSRVSNNTFGGIRVKAADYRIVNNIITENGTAVGSGSETGGVSIVLTTDKEEIFAHNTLHGNNAGGQLASAINCNTSNLVGINNIITSGPTAGDAVGLDLNNCQMQHSLFSGTVAPAGNFTGDPKLTLDYHIQSGSACIDSAADTDIASDIDGDPRPVGSADIGADEFVR